TRTLDPFDSDPTHRSKVSAESTALPERIVASLASGRGVGISGAHAIEICALRGGIKLLQTGLQVARCLTELFGVFPYVGTRITATRPVAERLPWQCSQRPNQNDLGFDVLCVKWRTTAHH